MINYSELIITTEIKPKGRIILPFMNIQQIIRRLQCSFKSLGPCCLFLLDSLKGGERQQPSEWDWAGFGNKAPPAGPEAWVYLSSLLVVLALSYLQGETEFVF